MTIFALDDILSTFKDGISRALRVKSETSITGGYSPANLTMQSAVTANGNGTNLDVNDYATAVLEIRGTFSATINFEGSIDDTNWYPIVATKNNSINGSVTTTTGLYEVKVATIKSVRARVSGYASGSITVIGKVSPLVNSEKSVQLTGSNVPLPIITQTELISADTTIANGGSYVSAAQTINEGVGVTGYYRTSASVTATLTLSFYDLATGLSTINESTLASGARNYGSVAVSRFPSKKMRLIVINGAGADIILKYAGYTITG